MLPSCWISLGSRTSRKNRFSRFSRSLASSSSVSFLAGGVPAANKVPPTNNVQIAVRRFMTASIIYGGLLLQEFDGFLQERIFLVFGLRLFGGLRQRFAVFIHVHLLVGFGHQGTGGDARVLNGLAARGVVLGHREDDGAAVIHGDGAAQGRIAVGALAHQFGALVVQQGGRGYLRTVRGAAVGEDHQGQLADR